MSTVFTVSGIGSTVHAQQRYVMNFRHLAMRRFAAAFMATRLHRLSARSAHIGGRVCRPQAARFLARAGRFPTRGF
jgi:hypothetical protein